MLLFNPIYEVLISNDWGFINVWLEGNELRWRLFFNL